MATKKKVGFYGFTGCAGDLLAIIHNEDDLVPVYQAAEVVAFLMAQRNNDDALPLDLAFVEGSLSTRAQVEAVTALRARARTLVAIGICACYGGPQAMATGDGHHGDRMRAVYGRIKFDLPAALEARAVDQVVKVDYYLPGCPIDAGQFSQLYAKLVNDLPPTLYRFPVCTECKWRENECLLLKNIPCLGTVTRAGCNARCPSFSYPCVGCFGPAEEANIPAQLALLKEKGHLVELMQRKLRIFGGSAMADRLVQLVSEKPAVDNG